MPHRFWRFFSLLFLTHGSPVAPLMSFIDVSSFSVKLRVQPILSAILKQGWLWWLLLPGCLGSWTGYIEEYDSIRVARCDAHCGSNYPVECMENCLVSNYTKPGYCPDKASMSPFEAVCLVACVDDSHCPDLAKCCSHDCGVTCMHPIGLENITDLPSIPENVQIRQHKNNLVLLTWRNSKKQHTNESAADKNVRYLVEERHLLGPRYLESRLSSWTVRHVSTKPHATLRDRLKTGHWYQFRVAAINANGSRGYSQPSRPFKTKEPRNPREPQNLTLSDARLVDGKLRITLRWFKPTSDVPITFYKVFWSRLVHGPTNDSILVYQRTVLKEQQEDKCYVFMGTIVKWWPEAYAYAATSILTWRDIRRKEGYEAFLWTSYPMDLYWTDLIKDKTCYELKDLELNCQYFLQVQAVALYGGRRLMSRKASKVFNSTDYMTYADMGRRSRRCERYYGDLHLRRMICHCDEVKVRLVWPTNPEVKAYNVSWKEGSCLTSQKNVVSHRKKSLWKVVQATHLDIRHLRSECTYNVKVGNILNGINNEEHSASIEVSATDCLKVSEKQNWDKFLRIKTIQCKPKSSKKKRHYTGYLS